MDRIGIVRKVMRLIEEGKFIDVKVFLADDFYFYGPTPTPIRASEWLGIHEKIAQGIPDFKYNLKNLNESGNVINGTVQLSGTHSKEMPVLLPGTLNVPATHKKICMPEEDIAFTFKKNQITTITVEKVPNGGVVGLLKQIGMNISTLK